MGSQPPKKKPQPTMEDALLDMRLFQKQLRSQANKSKKQAQAITIKAKNCLKNGDQQGAYLFLNTAHTKSKQSTDSNKMATKMAYLQMAMKDTSNKQQMLNNYVKLTPIIQKQAASTDLSSMATIIENFTDGMDNIKVNADTMDKLTMGDPSFNQQDIKQNMKQLQRQIQLDMQLQQEKDYKEKIDKQQLKQKLNF